MAQGERVRVVIEFTDDGPLGWKDSEETRGMVEREIGVFLGHLNMEVSIEESKGGTA